MNFNASLLREKFIIREKLDIADDHPLEFVAPSTRLPISLQSGDLPPEDIVVRTHSMHTCVRMAAKIIQNYERHGPITPRAKSIDWHELWHDVIEGYESQFVENKRVSVYHKGKVLFAHGSYHSFLDVIEKCDTLNDGDYNLSLHMAEEAFLKAGKNVSIHYDSNVALIAIIGDHDSRCSMILRGPERTTTFNYSLKPIDSSTRINALQILSSSADFLEGVQLSFLIGENTVKLQKGVIQKYSKEDKQTQHARDRLNQLSINIDTMEKRYQVRYRPERPDFGQIIKDTQKLSAKKEYYIPDDDDEVYIS